MGIVRLSGAKGLTSVKVVLDTTVFGQGFNTRSADVRLLKSFLQKTRSRLYVPTIVLEEAANLVRKSLHDVNGKLNDVQRLTGDEGAFPKVDADKALEAYSRSREELLTDLGAQILPYPNVEHEELMRRSLAPRKPFVGGGRGYRDALIWFSVLELAQSSDQEVAFVSANVKDFCCDEQGLQLHRDLLEDLQQRKLSDSGIRLFASLGQMIQKFAEAAFPETSASADPTLPVPNHRQLLVDGRELVEGMLLNQLPHLLGHIGRIDKNSIDVTGVEGPEDIVAAPIRQIDEARRLLQLSATYTVAFQLVIESRDFPAWQQAVSIHMRRHWDETTFKIDATTAVRLEIHMIERGEETEAFSLVSAQLANRYYKAAFLGIDPVAVKLRQLEIHAPGHETWGTVKCDSCGEEFGIGYHRYYPTGNELASVKTLEKLLADDHCCGRNHLNMYELKAQ